MMSASINEFWFIIVVVCAAALLGMHMAYKIGAADARRGMPEYRKLMRMSSDEREFLFLQHWFRRGDAKET